MKYSFQCAFCRKKTKSNPRSKNQKYCSNPICQKARKRKWQRIKMRNDPDYRRNQRESSAEWLKKNPDYYKGYRAANPDYVARNRKAQIVRNLRIRMIAKMDALTDEYVLKPGLYNIVKNPLSEVAKMDTSLHEIFIIPRRYRHKTVIANKDSIDDHHHFP